MVMVSLTTITIPTPQPYDSKDSQRQIENLCYVLLQIFSQAKATGDTDPFGLLSHRPNINLELDDLSIKTFGEAAIVESP
jgi:hypothetical protein